MVYARAERNKNAPMRYEILLIGLIYVVRTLAVYFIGTINPVNRDF